MTTLREAAQQALEALEEIADEVFSPYDNKLGDAILALRAALAQQDEPLNLRDPAVQKRLATQWGYVPAAQAEPVEPVAWMFESERNFNLVGYGGWEKRITERRPNALQSSVRNVTALYTAPPQRKPLTEEEIDKIFKHLCNTVGASCKTMARAVERAHGIKE